MSRQPLVVALAGNPNSGKTTVFNSLTGSRQHVGNWPGVTVEKKEGSCTWNGRRIGVVDLPGVYSLTAYSLDEVVARDYVVEEKPAMVVDVVDASNLERNLYLTVQFMEMETDLVIALNMMDVAEQRGYEIDLDRLSGLLGAPVVPMVAAKSRGRDELLKTVTAVAEGTVRLPERRMQYGKDIEAEIEKLRRVIEETVAGDARYPARWLAVKLLEEDKEIVAKITEQLGGDSALLRARNESLIHLKKVHGDDAETLIADARYGFISGLIAEVLKKPDVEKVTVTDRIDRIMLNRWLGIPLFFAILFGVFELTFAASIPLIDYIDAGLSWLTDHIGTFEPLWLSSLLTDGVIGGVGAVLAFVPVIFILYICLSILEDTGYLARAAFVMDRLMHRIGLHGRSFLSLILGFGCSVPAVMSARTIENPRDRLVTILVTPLISCGARLPVFVLLAAAFFTTHQGVIVFSLYAVGVLAAILLAWLFRKKLVPGESGHFVMELPPYRLPTVTNVAAHVWEHGWAFISRAGTFIFAAVFVIWLLDYFNVLEHIGRAVAPVLSPAGFGQWQAAVALIFGVLAKEAVIGAFGTLFAGAGAAGEGLGTALASQLGWTPLVAYAFMLMMLLYVPCVATLTTIKKETGSWKWTIFTIGYTLVLGWLAATLVYQIGSLLL